MATLTWGAAQEQKAIDERRRTLTASLPPPELFEGRERVLEVKRVAWEGDRRWINRLNHELVRLSLSDYASLLLFIWRFVWGVV